MTNQENTVRKERLEMKLIFKSIFLIVLIVAITFITAVSVNFSGVVRRKKI